jgi:hypothetical protein
MSGSTDSNAAAQFKKEHLSVKYGKNKKFKSYDPRDVYNGHELEHFIAFLGIKRHNLK